MGSGTSPRGSARKRSKDLGFVGSEAPLCGGIWGLGRAFHFAALLQASVEY